MPKEVASQEQGEIVDILGWGHIGDTCADEVLMTACFLWSLMVAFFIVITPRGGRNAV